MKPKSIKPIEGNTGKKILDVGLDDNFLNKSQKSQVTKTKTHKWDYIKLKSYAQQGKQSIVESQPRQQEKIFSDHISDRRPISKI